MKKTFVQLKIANKARFLGVSPYFFADIMENGNKLVVGNTYTVSSKKVLSSHTIITLEETGGLEYNDHWFEKV